MINHPRSVGLAGQRWASCVPPSVEDDVLLGNTKWRPIGDTPRRHVLPKRDESNFRKQPFAKDLSWKTYSLCANNAEQRVAWDIVSHMFLNVPHYWITTWDIWMHFVPPWTHANAASDFLSNFPCLDCIVDGVKVLCGGKTTVASSFSFVTPSWTPNTCCLHARVWRTCRTNFKAFKQASCWRCPWLVPVFRPACKFFWANVSVWNSSSKINGDTEILYISIARYLEANGTPLYIYIYIYILYI